MSRWIQYYFAIDVLDGAQDYAGFYISLVDWETTIPRSWKEQELKDLFEAWTMLDFLTLKYKPGQYHDMLY